MERKFWQVEGVWLTMVGYAGGFTPNPTYKETCTQLTGHNEVVRVIFDPARVSYEALLKLFWENHDPTQGMRQGNDVGSTYRSGIYTFSDAQAQAARSRRPSIRRRLRRRGGGRSPPRSCPRRCSTMPRTITSSTWRRTPTAIAASAARG